MLKNIAVIGVLTILNGFLCTPNTSAGGFDNLGIGSAAMMRGSTFTGLAEDGSAVYYNPAALAFLENDKWQMEGYLWATTIGYEYTATYDDGSKIRSKTNTDAKDLSFVPGGFASRTYDRLAIGFGFYVPYAGGGSDYSGFQQTNTDLSGFAGFLAATAATGYKVSETLSLGAALSLYSGTMETENSFVYTPDAPVVTPYRNEFSELLAGYGGHVGIYYQPSDIWSFGLTLRSRITIEMDGTEKFAGGKFRSGVEFTLPRTVDFGVGLKPNEDLTLTAMISRRFYSSMDEISFDVTGDAPTHYNNCWNAGLGLKYRINDNLALSGGLKFLQGTSADEHLNPTTTDIDFIIPSIGLSYKNIDISLIVSLSPERTYNNQTYNSEHYSLLIGMKF